MSWISKMRFTVYGFYIVLLFFANKIYPFDFNDLLHCLSFFIPTAIVIYSVEFWISVSK